jgi:hypothetical protein
MQAAAQSIAGLSKQQRSQNSRPMQAAMQSFAHLCRHQCSQYSWPMQAAMQSVTYLVCRQKCILFYRQQLGSSLQSVADQCRQQCSLLQTCAGSSAMTSRPVQAAVQSVGGLCRQQFSLLQTCEGSSTVCIHDLYGRVCNVFDACIFITRENERGFGPGNRDFFGLCEMASSRAVRRVSWSPKKPRFPGPNPLPLAQVMHLHASNTLRTGPYKS